MLVRKNQMRSKRPRRVDKSGVTRAHKRLGRITLKETRALTRFKAMMATNACKLSFAAYCE